MAQNKESFLHWVELHERAWGSDTYPKRPSLEAILNARCVTFWRPIDGKKDARYTIKLFEKQSEIEHYFVRLLLRSNIEEKSEKLARIFIDQKRYILAKVRITLQEVETDS